MYEQNQQETTTPFPQHLLRFPSISKTGFKALRESFLSESHSTHLLGTDQSTRDIAVRMLYGTKIALSIGIIAVSIYVSIGIFIGSIAVFSVNVDLAVVRFIEYPCPYPVCSLS